VSAGNINLVLELMAIFLLGLAQKTTHVHVIDVRRER
jgi:hypothetical protein